MTKEELIKKIFSYKKNKVQLDIYKEKLEELTYKITQSYSGMPVSNCIDSKNENYILKKESYEENIRNLDKDIKIVDRAMTTLRKNEFELITLRYIEGYTPSEVYNVFLHISKKTFFRHHNNAIEKMLDIINI